MNFNTDHDRFVAKNRSLASAYESEQREQNATRRELSPQKRENEGSCFNCKAKPKCADFRAKRNGGTSGVVSFGGSSSSMRCDKYVPAPAQSRTMSDKAIKSLMKNFRRGV
jgi:hypothetical protein